MMLLTLAKALIAVVSFDRWRNSLGSSKGIAAISRSKRLAAQVERAAARLPFESQCLPRAMALSWLLRRTGIKHSFVFAVRPDSFRDNPDALHAWVESEGVRMIGDLPGPWIETLRLE